MDFNLPVKTNIFSSDFSKDAISQTKYALSQLDLPDHDISVDQIDFMTAEPNPEKELTLSSIHHTVSEWSSKT